MLGGGAVAVSGALCAKARGADAGAALGVGGADGVVAQVVDAIADEVAVFAGGALVVSDALCAEAGRADAGEALGVGGADGVVAEVVDATSDEVAVLARDTLVVALAFEAGPECARLALAGRVCAAAAPGGEWPGEADAPVADVGGAIRVCDAQDRCALSMHAAVAGTAIETGF